MQFERREIRDLSQAKYDKLSEFLSAGGSDLSLINSVSNTVYAFAGTVPEQISGVFFSKAVKVYHYDGMDMQEIGSLTYDTIVAKQGSDGYVHVDGLGEGRMAFEILIDEALFDPSAINFFD